MQIPFKKNLSLMQKMMGLNFQTLGDQGENGSNVSLANSEELAESARVGRSETAGKGRLKFHPPRGTQVRIQVMYLCVHLQSDGQKSKCVLLNSSELTRRARQK